MRSENTNLLKALQDIAQNAHAIDLDDQSSVAQLGASLEQIFHSDQSDQGELTALFDLCLIGLRAVHQKAIGNSKPFAQALTFALDAAAEKFAQDNLKDDSLFLKDAAQQLYAILNQNADSLARAFGIDTEEVALHAFQGLTFNDLAAFLIQADPHDNFSLTQLQMAFDVILCTQALPPSARQYVVSALQAIRDQLNFVTEDIETTFTQVSQYLEKTMEIMEDISFDLAMKQEEPAELHEAASKKPPKEAKQPPKNNAKTGPMEAEKGNLPADSLPADIDAGLLRDFVAECLEYTEGAEAALLTLEKDPDNKEAINTVFRAFHTIKGTSAFLGLERISEFAHRAESFLSRMRDGEIRCTGDYADLSLRAIDIVKSLILSVEGAISGNPMFRPDNYDEMLKTLANPEAMSGESSYTSGAKDESVFEVNSGKEEKGSAVASLDEGELLEKSHQQSPASAAENGVRRNEPNISNKPQWAEEANAADSSVRVRTDRLDRLIDMVGELVIAHSMVAQDELVNRGQLEITKKITQVGKIIRELQGLSMSMRMIPLKATFQKIARLARDLAHKSGKQVHFISEGEETEIDRNMVELVKDPLVHMVRNAIDHGLESPDDREKVGKPKLGTIRLTAYHASGNVVVKVQDDGKGLDRTKILKKAIDRGLVDADKALSDSEVFNFIFSAGFSTAERITDISGRGVGMDVVRKNVESLRGHIDISSVPGKGCTFTLSLPLTLAITEGMLVKVGSERYIVPTVNIQFTFRPEPGMLSTIGGRGEMIMLRGELVPMFRFHRLFNISDAVTDPSKGLLLLVGDNDRRCALLVDELIGKQQVVAKSLGVGMGKIMGVSGAAILGDGCVGLILDTPEIISLARQTPTGDRDKNAAKYAA
jgi:two-component system chemotaxis sensor kinase CheA